jgi:hypothetical protein
MPRYLISFDDGSMDHIPEEDWPAVGEAAHAVVRDAKAARIWIFGGGVQRQQSRIVATDGTITDGPVPETKSVVGGFSIIEVPSRQEAVAWAARIAKACRCPPRGSRDHVRPGVLNQPDGATAAQERTYQRWEGSHSAPRILRRVPGIGFVEPAFGILRNGMGAPTADGHSYGTPSLCANLASLFELIISTSEHIVRSSGWRERTSRYTATPE